MKFYQDKKIRMQIALFLLFTLVIIFIKLITLTLQLRGLIAFMYFIMFIIYYNKLLIKLPLGLMEIMLFYSSMVKEALQNLKKNKYATFLRFSIFIILYTYFMPLEVSKDLYILTCIILDRLFFGITITIWLQCLVIFVKNTNWYKNRLLKREEETRYLIDSPLYGFYCYRATVNTTLVSSFIYMLLLIVFIDIAFAGQLLYNKSITILLEITNLYTLNLDLNLSYFLCILLVFLLFLRQIYSEISLYILEKRLFKVKNLKKTIIASTLPIKVKEKTNLISKKHVRNFGIFPPDNWYNSTPHVHDANGKLVPVPPTKLDAEFIRYNDMSTLNQAGLYVTPGETGQVRSHATIQRRTSMAQRFGLTGKLVAVFTAFTVYEYGTAIQSTNTPVPVAREYLHKNITTLAGRNVFIGDTDADYTNMMIAARYIPEAIGVDGYLDREIFRNQYEQKVPREARDILSHMELAVVLEFQAPAFAEGIRIQGQQTIRHVANNPDTFLQDFRTWQDQQDKGKKPD